MAILSLGEIPALQKILSEYGCKIHVHDACGGQAFSLEFPGEPAEGLYPALEAFFAAHSMQLHYYDKRNFTAK